MRVPFFDFAFGVKYRACVDFLIDLLGHSCVDFQAGNFCLGIIAVTSGVMVVILLVIGPSVFVGTAASVVVSFFFFLPPLPHPASDPIFCLELCTQTLSSTSTLTQ